MARILTEMPQAEVGKYPWDVWFDGKPRELVKGEDFKVSAHTMRMNAISAAVRRGINLKVKVKGNTVSFQAGKPLKPTAGVLAAVPKVKKAQKAK